MSDDVTVYTFPLILGLLRYARYAGEGGCRAHGVGGATCRRREGAFDKRWRSVISPEMVYACECASTHLNSENEMPHSVLKDISG